MCGCNNHLNIRERFVGLQDLDWPIVKTIWNGTKRLPRNNTHAKYSHTIRNPEGGRDQRK